MFVCGVPLDTSCTATFATPSNIVQAIVTSMDAINAYQVMFLKVSNV